ncbi:uncharacterized protein AB675_1729 [Cyphellophora attinorum]|uniref:Uncharacterized protein n=1 Tax=Cyphellophora attinorum TaxID=1664694 RepID=A0A0N1HXZ8_9EURO|nr:uncharacterized protein AB675_1729 [Phialophora attinorum]KPI43060.1 hypothetical protein AB675_1729 [Phialophora attinorum]
MTVHIQWHFSVRILRIGFAIATSEIDYFGDPITLQIWQKAYTARSWGDSGHYDAATRGRRKAHERAVARTARKDDGLRELTWVSVDRPEGKQAADTPYGRLHPLIQQLHEGFRSKACVRRWYGASGPELTFPLTSDHLMPLVQYNLKRAAMTNASILDRIVEQPSKIWADDDCDVLERELVYFSGSSRLHEVPLSLLPTSLQRGEPHKHWIDLIPDPMLRDNIIRESQRTPTADLVLDDLLSDLAGCLTTHEQMRGTEVSGRAMIIVWTTPWSPWGLEVTEAFQRKWGRLLYGCRDILLATNMWRRERGERPLFVVS